MRLIKELLFWVFVDLLLGLLYLKEPRNHEIVKVVEVPDLSRQSQHHKKRTGETAHV